MKAKFALPGFILVTLFTMVMFMGPSLAATAATLGTAANFGAMALATSSLILAGAAVVMEERRRNTEASKLRCSRYAALILDRD